MAAKQTDINGFIEVKHNPISKAGIYDYYGYEINAPDPNKLYRVLRTPESLEQAAPLFKGVPIVNDHTMIGNGETAPEKKGIDGVIGDEVYYKDGTIYANLRFFTNRIKDLIAKGKKELSVGYWSTYEFKGGNWQGKTYDAIQHIVGGNHLALVDEGRMGSSVAVLDHKPYYTQFTFTFDSKGIKPMYDENEEMNEKDIVPTEDIEEETSEADGIYEDPEHEKEEMATLKSVAEGINALNSKLDELVGILGKIHGYEKQEAERETAEAVEDEQPTEPEEIEKMVMKKTEDAIAKRVQHELTAKAKAESFIKPLVGTADHSARSSKQIWDYAAKKLNLAGDSETAVRCYAQGLKQAKPEATQDSKSSAVIKFRGKY